MVKNDRLGRMQDEAVAYYFKVNSAISWKD
jgi:hypothetical protein